MATITSAGTGLASATTTWVGGVVPGTTYAGTRTTTGAAVAIGATSIPVTATGPVVTAGKWLKIGSEQYRVATGLAASTAGNIVIDAPGLRVAIPASATSISVDLVSDKVIVASGHDVTYNLTFGVWGDGTSSTTLASNAIVVSGTLRGHATIPWSLTCVGSIVEGPGGAVIFDQSAGGSGTLILNSGGTLGQNGFVTLLNGGNSSVTIKGITRRRKTSISNAAASGSSVIRVADATGWGVGDVIEVASDTDDQTRSHYATVSGIATVSGAVCDITLSVPLNVDRQLGCLVINLSSNMVVKSSSATAPTFFALAATSTSSILTLDIDNVRFENICSSSGWTGASQTNIHYNGLSILTNTPQYIVNSAIEWTHGLSTQTGSGMMMVCGNSMDKGGFTGCVARSNAASGSAYLFGNIAQAECSNNTVTRSFNGIRSTNGIGAFAVACTGDAIWCANSVYVGDAGSLNMNQCETHGSYALSSAAGALSYSGGYVGVMNRLMLHSNASVAKSVFFGTELNITALTSENTTGSRPTQSSNAAQYFVNGNQNDSRDVSYYRICKTDSVNTFKETYSVKIQPKVANTAITYTFKIPAVAGVAHLINPALMFDATYGTATPPIISLIGQGVADSWTCPATAGQWFSHAFTFTPTSTGDITVTVTVQSASTAGFVWLGGIYHYPMIQSVRQWGYQWLPQAALITDARITLSEAAALALPVSVNHGTSTVTISGSVTPSEALQAMLADLVQTANNARAVHVTGDGTTFVTTYTVILSGSGAVSGPYTDSAGLHVTISASAILSGSRVQIYNVTDSVELYNNVLSTSGLTYPLVWTADKTIRVRVTKIGYLPLSLTGVLTGSGLTFLDAQAVDSVYTTNGVDGSLVTGIADDNTNIQIDVATNTTVQNIYAWLRLHETGAGGVSGPLFNSITAVDEVNYVVNTDVASVQLDNVSSGPILVTGGQITRKDGANIIAPTSNSIQIQPGKSYVSHADISATAIAVRDVALSGSTLGAIITETGIRVISG